MLDSLRSNRVHQLLLIFFLSGAASLTALRWVSSERVGRSEEVRAEPYPIMRCQVAPIIDGQLSDACWRTAPSTHYFVDPGTGKPNPSSRVQARAWLGWKTDDSGAALYGIIQVLDAHPTSPFKLGDVDPHIWESASGVEIMFQPEIAKPHYYEIQIDVSGAIWDTAFDDYNQPIVDTERGKMFGHQDWSAHLERAVFIDAIKGVYLIEFKLPLVDPYTVRPFQRWRMNLYSFKDGQSDALSWSPLMGEGNFHLTRRFRTVIFR